MAGILGGSVWSWNVRSLHVSSVLAAAEFAVWKWCEGVGEIEVGGGSVAIEVGLAGPWCSWTCKGGLS